MINRKGPWLVVLCTVLALASTASLAGPATIQFNVYDRDTGELLDPVHVIVLNAYNAEQVAAADIAGSGTLGVPAGEYRIRFSEGHLGDVLYHVQWAGTPEPSDVFSSAAIFRVPADITTVVDQGLVGGLANPPAHSHWSGTIAGTVTGVSGSGVVPLAGIRVFFMNTETALLEGCAPYKPGLESPPPAVTDANGFYSCVLSQLDHVELKVRFADSTGAYRPEFFGAGGEDLFDLGQVVDMSELPEISEQMVQDTPAQSTRDLIEDITNETWPDSVETSLNNPLESAVDVLADSNPNNDRSACGHLKGFRGQLPGKVASGSLTQAEADELDARAQSIQQGVGCK